MELNCEDHFSKESIQFLESIHWGTKSILFKELNMEIHLCDLKNPKVYTLRDHNKQIGALIAFINFKVHLSNQLYDAQFVRFLSASPNPEIKGFPRLFIFKIDEILKTAIKNKSLVYCFVESGNVNSQILVKRKGFIQATIVKTIGISRFFPKLKINPEKILEENEKAIVIKLINKKYHNYNLLHFDSLFSGEGYYVYREKGEIIAGVQIKKINWSIEKLSSTKGTIIKSILPFIPIANRIIKKNKFDFLIFDFIYYKAGRLADFIKLQESLLFTFRMNCGMIWCDEKSFVYKELSTQKSLGVLNAIVQTYDSHLYILKDTLPINNLEDIKHIPFMVNPTEFI